MGGALILIAIGVTILLWGDLRTLTSGPVLVVTLGFGAWLVTTGARWSIASGGLAAAGNTSGSRRSRRRQPVRRLFGQTRRPKPT